MSKLADVTSFSIAIFIAKGNSGVCYHVTMTYVKRLFAGLRFLQRFDDVIGFSKLERNIYVGNACIQYAIFHRPQARTGDATSNTTGAAVTQTQASVIRISPQKVGSLSVHSIPMIMATANKLEPPKSSILLPISSSNILERALTSAEVIVVFFWLKIHSFSKFVINREWFFGRANKIRKPSYEK